MLAAALVFSLAGRHILNTANTSRSGRYFGRANLHRVSNVKSCRECGRVTVAPGGLVGVRATSSFASAGGGITSGYAGLSTCGRIWLCPVCNSKVMAYRAIEIGSVLSWAAEQGHLVIWGSLTVRHNRGDGLRDLIDIQRGAWRRVVQSKLWKRWATSEGGDRVGYIRASEITVGANGWHPHFHPIIIVKGDRVRAVWFAQELERLWVDAVEAEGGNAMRGNGSQKLSVLTGADSAVGLHEYVMKSQYRPQALALEAVWSQSKTSSDRKPRVTSTMPHWALLDAAGQGLAVEGLQWWEFEQATEGHRMITWSRDLRSLAGLLEEELADDVVAARELGSMEDTVCFITPAGWRGMRDVPGLVVGVLEELELNGWAGLRDFLDYHGIEWVSLDDAAPGDARVLQLVKELGEAPRHAPGGSGVGFVPVDGLANAFGLADGLE